MSGTGARRRASASEPGRRAALYTELSSDRWLCWVTNLVVVEWLVLTRPASALQQSARDASKQTGVV